MDGGMVLEQAATAAPIIVANAVKRSFGRGTGAVHVLKGVDLSIGQGKLIAFKGRSGSGKTTLINLLSALDRPSEGDIVFQGRKLSALGDKERDHIRRKEMGLIFQSFALIPLMSAYENIEFVLRVAGVPASERKTAAEVALEQVGLKGRMHHRPFELSGGEQQRTAIARAIAHRPKLLLADEPTAELDSRTGLQIMRVFRGLVESTGMTIIMTTHDPAIMEIVDHVYELEDGRIVVSTH
jgi:putative ABC transport system ATP-binding protein